MSGWAFGWESVPRRGPQHPGGHLGGGLCRGGDPNVQVGIWVGVCAEEGTPVSGWAFGGGSALRRVPRRESGQPVRAAAPGPPVPSGAGFGILRLGTGWIRTRAVTSPRPFPCRFTSAGIAGAVSAHVEGAQPLPSSLTRLTTGALVVSAGCSGGGAGGELRRCLCRGVLPRAGDWQCRGVWWWVLARCRECFLFLSSSMAGAAWSPAGAVRHEGESGATAAQSSFRLIPARLDAGFPSPAHRLEELAPGLSPLTPQNPPPAAAMTPQLNSLRIPTPAKPHIPTKPLGKGFAGLWP